MAEGRGSNNLRLYVITLAFTMIFPVLGYTFTNLPGVIGDYDTSISDETLMLAGITLTDAESHDLTWTGAFQYYNVSNKLFRVQWKADWRDPWITPIGDGIAVERPGSFEWWDANKVRLTSWVARNNFKVITNASIVSEYDINYNWTRYVTDTGFQVLITPYTRGVSINTAVYDEAHLNVTLGTALVESSTFNFRQFVNWYFSMLLGETSFGLPSVFSWMIRLISAISVLSAILLAKELISL
jgi:hypothetical protein